MHLGNGMISPECAALSAVVAAAGVGLVAFARRRAALPGLADAPPDPARFAAATALVFAMQGFNVPVGHGVTGHLLGGVLLAHWFGGLWATGAMAIVLLVQGLLFADGGLGALGANLLNMAVLPCLVVYPVARRLIRSPMPRLAVAAWVSVVTGALLCAVQALSLPAARPAAGELLSAVLSVHAVTGVLEAALTCAAVALAPRLVGPMGVRPGPTLTAAGLLLAVGWLGQSPWPDGLEHALESTGLTALSGALSALDAVQARLAGAFSATDPLALPAACVVVVLLALLLRAALATRGENHA